MRPPAFIVMPFGVKEFEHHDSVGSVKDARIDFTRVGNELLFGLATKSPTIVAAR